MNLITVSALESVLKVIVASFDSKYDLLGYFKHLVCLVAKFVGQCIGNWHGNGFPTTILKLGWDFQDELLKNFFQFWRKKFKYV